MDMWIVDKGLGTVNEDIKQWGWSQMDKTYKTGQG